MALGYCRQERAAIKPVVLYKTVQAIAAQIISMKRLWQGKGLDGLLHRRDDEAKLVQGAKRSYLLEELVRIVVASAIDKKASNAG